MSRRPFILLLLSILLYCSGCASSNHIPKQQVRKMFRQSTIMNSHFTGFALYDMDKHTSIFELNADKYFTPASNTKLFTYYTCLKMLGDSIPGINYTIKGDSLLFWGTGDPSFLQADLKGNKAFVFLKQHDQDAKANHCS